MTEPERVSNLEQAEPARAVADTIKLKLGVRIKDRLLNTSPRS